MSTEQNAALVRRYFSDCVSGVTAPDRARALSLVDELLSEARHATSGNHVDVLAADFFSVRDGRVTELRRFMDFADFRSQLKGRSSRR